MSQHVEISTMMPDGKIKVDSQTSQMRHPGDIVFYHSANQSATIAVPNENTIFDGYIEQMNTGIWPKKVSAPSFGAFFAENSRNVQDRQCVTARQADFKVITSDLDLRYLR